MDNRITIGKVHVVEWLRPEDQETGLQLLDEIEPLGVIS